MGGSSTGHSEDRIGEFEGSSVGTSQAETQKETRIKKKKKSRTFGSCETISRGPVRV